MLESIIFSIGLVLNANDASKEMHLKRQEQDRCLIVKECYVVYDYEVQSWFVRKKVASSEKEPNLGTKDQ